MLERKKAEKKIKKTSEEWMKTFDAISDLVYTLDKDFRFVRVNKATCEILKKEPEELIGKRCFEVLHGTDKPWPNCPCKKTLLTKKAATEEINDPNLGIPLLITTSPIFDDEGELIGCVHIAKDITERKKAEENLRFLKEFSERVVDSIDDALLVIDPNDYTIISANEAASKQLKLRKEDLIGKTCYETTHHRSTPCKPPHDICPIQEMLKTGKAVTVEHTHFDKDNNEIYVEVSASPVRKQEGKIIQAVHLARDITDRKKKEESLRRSEDQARRLLEFQNKVIDTADVLINLLDPEGNVTLWNRAAELIIGYSREEVIGDKKIWEWIYPDPKYRAKIFAQTKKIMEEGECIENDETTIRSKDGTLKTIRWHSSSILDEKGKPVGLIGVGIDITERKQMEKKLVEYSQNLEEMVDKRTRELKESEEKLKDLFKTIPDSIAIVDLNGKLLEFNETTLKLFGYPREKIIGKNVFDFIAEEDLERIARGFKQTLEEGFVRIQFLVLAKNGRKIPVELNASALKDPKGNLVGFVAVLRDITERKSMQEQLLKSERLAAIGELATMVGHDLRNPLTSIQNACYYLKMKLGTSKNEKVKKMFGIIDKEINYSNNIIKDLLNFSRVKKPDLKKVDLISSIQDALAQLKFPENITLTTKFSEVPTIEADPDQLRRIFQNIALNGMQAMPKDGKLTVSTRKNGDFVEVAFTDTGVGIPEENMGKLFTPLFTTKAQGVGLGLAICKNLVEGHNGRIEVKSKVGEGSTFTVKLPIHHNKGGEKQT